MPKCEEKFEEKFEEKLRRLTGRALLPRPRDRSRARMGGWVLRCL
jgi:hypothetical protein